MRLQVRQENAATLQRLLDADELDVICTRPLRAGPDQWRVTGDAVAAEGGEVADGLDEVGLALGVRADEGRHALLDREVEKRVRAEVGQRQVGNVHGGQARLTGLGRVRLDRVAAELVA